MQVDVIRAWKDPNYRNSLSADQLASLPANPAGSLECVSPEKEPSPHVTTRGCHPNTNDGTYTCVLQ